jgi:hypothetical protein
MSDAAGTYRRATRHTISSCWVCLPFEQESKVQNLLRIKNAADGRLFLEKCGERLLSYPSYEEVLLSLNRRSDLERFL